VQALVQSARPAISIKLKLDVKLGEQGLNMTSIFAK
jgi:hypothetical protein